MRKPLAALFASVIAVCVGAATLAMLESRAVALACAVAAGYIAFGEIGDLLGTQRRTPQPRGAPLLQNSVLRRRILGVLVVGGAVALIATHLVLGDVEVDGVRDWIRGLGPWGPILLIVVLAVAMVFAPIPNPPFMIAAGLAWGTVLGVIYSVIGQAIGSAFIFLISRKLGRRFIPRLIGQAAAERVDVMALSMGPHLVFWWRMMPVSFDFAAYAAGLTSMRFRTFITLVVAGSILPTTAVVAFGDSFDSSWPARAVTVAIILVAMAVPGTIFYLRFRHELPSLRSILRGSA